VEFKMSAPDTHQDESGVEDFNSLLRLAEELRESCERRLSRQTTVELVASMLVVTGVLTGAYSFRLPVNSQMTVLALAGGAVLVVYGFIFALSTAPLRRRIWSDRAALFEVVAMLREVSSSMATNGGISILERANINIRLARFEIMPTTLWSSLLMGAASNQPLRKNDGASIKLPSFGTTLFPSIVTYDCATNTNYGQLEEERGQLNHDYGKLAFDRVNGIRKLVWSWSRERTRSSSSVCLIYGPYTDDLVVPGDYSVKFYVRAVGLNISSLKSAPVLLLDVAFSDGTEIGSHRIVAAGELSSYEYHPLELRVKSQGRAVCEYRVSVFDGKGQSVNEVAKFESVAPVQIYFDKVTVERVE
jgi:hypothetical protein